MKSLMTADTPSLLIPYKRDLTPGCEITEARVLRVMQRHYAAISHYLAFTAGDVHAVPRSSRVIPICEAGLQSRDAP